MTIAPAAGQDAIALTDLALDRLADRARVPSYDRTALSPAVVHLGLGAFHRAHQAVYLDELAERGISEDWGIVAVSLRRRFLKDALDPQDGLYTVVERGGSGGDARIVGSVIEVRSAPDEPERVLGALAAPSTKIVTLTVTDQGYVLDAAGRAVALDLLVAGLKRRRAAGLAPFTVVSCDNVPGNGATARAAVLQVAERRGAGIATWIEREVSFPATVVDRITPATTDATRAFVVRELGIDDRAPVVTERFTQWVIEDAFCNGRPPLEEVGVQFVSDVAPYERMKKRLLNGGQAALGYVGWLLGHRDTAAAMADPLLRRYVERLMREEIAPLLEPAPGIDLDAYRRTLVRRLADPMVRDQLARLCRRGSAKVPAHLLPTIVEAQRTGRPHTLATLAVAAWLRYLRGTDLHGREIPVADPRWPQLRALAVDGGDDPAPLMRASGLFGSLADDPQAVADIGGALRDVERAGLRAALIARLDGNGRA